MNNNDSKKGENQIKIFKSSHNQTSVEIEFDGETVWLNRQQLSLLFDRDVKTIGKHINNVFSEGELEQTSTVAKFATVQNGVGRKSSPVNAYS